MEKAAGEVAVAAVAVAVALEHLQEPEQAVEVQTVRAEEPDGLQAGLVELVAQDTEHIRAGQQMDRMGGKPATGMEDQEITEKMQDTT